VTEVPEHLLQRSRERRAALGLGGGDAPAPAGESSAAPATTGASPAPAAAASPAPAAAAAPALPALPPVDPAIYVKLEKVKRNKVPAWVLPVIVALPFYGFLYAGAFGSRQKEVVLTPEQLGAQIFATKGCSDCHGSHGEGNVGPKLAGGEVVKTFPNEADHIAWVKSGSLGSTANPTPYGDPGREGGQHISKGGMPSFASQLSEAEIEAVVKYEREGLK
jgi:mono/diheme cytochrome c family protein